MNEPRPKEPDIVDVKNMVVTENAYLGFLFRCYSRAHADSRTTKLYYRRGQKVLKTKYGLSGYGHT
jgi:hypothetical protein